MRSILILSIYYSLFFSYPSLSCQQPLLQDNILNDQSVFNQNRLSIFGHSETGTTSNNGDMSLATLSDGGYTNNDLLLQADSCLSEKTFNTFNVKDFGAQGDGISNDAKAIQNAINVAGKNGGIVYFPEGIYLVRNTLIPKSNIIIRGSGKRSLIQYSFPVFKDARRIYYGWHFTNQRNVHFNNIAMDGGAKNYASNPVNADGAYFLIYFNPVNSNAVIDVSIDSCYFAHSFDSAIQSYGRAADPYPHPTTNNIKIRNCYFFETGAHGVGMNEWRNSLVTNCEFKNIGKKIMIAGFGSGMGVDVSAGSENIIVSDNAVDGAAGGFKAETHNTNGGLVQSKNIVIKNNEIKNLYTGGEYSVWYGIRVNGIGVTVENNSIESYMHGILVTQYAKNCRIIRNYIHKTMYKDAAGIRLDKSFGNNVFIDNRIEFANAQGMLISGDSTILLNNSVSYAGLDGIRIFDANDIICSYNLSFNNGRQGIAIAPINGTVRNVVLEENLTFDLRRKNKRTQQRGIYVSPEKVTEVYLYKNTETGNIITDQTFPPNTKTIKSNRVKRQFMNQIPSTGKWKWGDIVYNSKTRLYGYIGWICVDGGSPGRWIGFGETPPSDIEQ
jgi:hypothetical protein